VRIGIFDSGIGGLTVLHALRRHLPGHDYVYLGDTARIPYGTRSSRTVTRYAHAVASHLYGESIDALVIACNTATAHALPTLEAAGAAVGLQVVGVIEPGVRAALAAHQQGAIAVLGTTGTIQGGAYQQALKAAQPSLEVHAVPCPLFVPLVEEGWLVGNVPHEVALTYLGHLRNRVDVAILGCTHYPLLKPTIQEVLPGVTLVDSAFETAKTVAERLGTGATTPGQCVYQVTDNVERFQRVGARFLGEIPHPVTWVDLPPASGPFALP